MTASTRYCWVTDAYLAELFFTAHMGRVGITACSRPAEVGTTLCAGHKREIFGELWAKVTVKRSEGISLLWVVTSPDSFREMGFRSHARALAEADYRARQTRWRAAKWMADRHSCDACHADDKFGAGRLEAARTCPHNLASMWLKSHTIPLPPEEGR